MDEPKRIPLTDNPKIKEPKRIRLWADEDKILDDIDIDNENNKQNNSIGIQKLDSDKTS